jgi:hypothetical protein
LKRRFSDIGARLRVDIGGPGTPAAQRTRGRRFPRGQDFTIDVGRDREGETFELAVRPDSAESLELVALDVQPERRHLLLMAKRLGGTTADKRKFLCGHDERHWFVAPVPASGAATVEQAMESLKPLAAQAAQRRRHVRRKNWHDRKNDGFVRQGEWFFLPRPEFEPPSASLVLHNEPIRRPGGTPHVVEQLYRHGGTVVYVHPKYPGGLSERQYEALLKRQPEARSWPWQVMRRNPRVFARGKVRHPDHATIELARWHEVMMSAEQRAANVVFLD